MERHVAAFKRMRIVNVNEPATGLDGLTIRSMEPVNSNVSLLFITSKLMRAGYHFFLHLFLLSPTLFTDKKSSFRVHPQLERLKKKIASLDDPHLAVPLKVYLILTPNL